MFARSKSEPDKTRVVAQSRDAEFERLLRTTFGMDAKVDLSVVNGVFAEQERKLETSDATVVILDIDPSRPADLARIIGDIAGRYE